MEGGARGVSEAVEQTSAITYCWIGKGTRVHAAHSLDSITTHACTALAAQVQVRARAACIASGGAVADASGRRRAAGESDGRGCSVLAAAGRVGARDVRAARERHRVWRHQRAAARRRWRARAAATARAACAATVASVRTACVRAEGIAFLQALVSSCESELATCDADALPAIRAIFVLRDAMARHNSRSRLSAVQAQLSGVRAILATNIDRVLERGESLDAVVARTDDLRDHANVFRTRSRALRRRFWWRSVRMALAAVLLLLLLAFLIFLAACRGFKCIH